MDVKVHLTAGTIVEKAPIELNILVLCDMLLASNFLPGTRPALVNGSEVDSANRTNNFVAFSTIGTVPAADGGRSYIGSLRVQKRRANQYMVRCVFDVVRGSFIV